MVWYFVFWVPVVEERDGEVEVGGGGFYLYQGMKFSYVKHNNALFF